LKRALGDDADVARRPERYSHKWHKLARVNSRRRKRE